MPPRDLTLNLQSKFDTRLGLHAVPKRMFHQGHLSYKIGHINECIRCVPASNDYMGHSGLGSEGRKDFVYRQIIVAQDDITIIGTYHYIQYIRDHPLDIITSNECNT